MELHKKVVWNAMAAYFMVFVSVFFLLSKSPYINHPFVKSHVKSAFSLHVLLALVLYIMSYPFLGRIEIIGYSLNNIITMVLSLIIFWGILYWIYQAHNEKTVTLWEMFHKAGGSSSLISQKSTKNLWEEHTLILILAHVPFFGYILRGKYPELPHMREITLLNLFITLLSVLLTCIGHVSLASIIMLGYIIWSVFQGVRLVFGDELTVISLSQFYFPAPEEKYTLQKALLSYTGNSLKKRSFIPLQKLIEDKRNTRLQQEQKNTEAQKKKKASPLPAFLSYIPLVNIICLFTLKSRESFHIKNGLILTLITIFILATLGFDSPALLLVLFPILYGIWYHSRLWYKMPYIYDIAAFLSYILHGVTHIFHRTRKLQKTTKKVSIKVWETKK